MNRAQSLMNLCESPMLKPLAPEYVKDLEAQNYSAFDELTAKHSAFKTFLDLLDAKGGYRPSIKLQGRLPEPKAELSLLAQLYDKAQELRGDSRRAYVTA